ncbi:neutral amino acid transport system permease protein [Rhodococcus sp. 27YEA15]
MSVVQRHDRPFVRRIVAGALFALFAVLAATGMAAAQESADPPTGSVPVSGTLNNGGARIAGATVQALDAAGTEVASVQSTQNGSWELALPPGTYSFGVVADTLPPGVSVQGAVVRDVAAGRANTVIFSFGEVRTASEVSPGEKLLRTTVDGLRFGLVIAIAGVGLSLIYGTTGLTNFAHSEMVTLGGVAAWVLNTTLGIPLIPATGLAIVVGIGIGVLANAAVWKPLRKRKTGLIAQLVVSIGLAISVRYLILIFFSDRSEPFDDYQGQVEKKWGPIALTDANATVMAVSLAVLLAVAVLLSRTRIGKAMRAVADNRDLAASSGIDVERVVMFVWALGGGLAALGGVLYGISELGGRVQWEMGFKLLLLMFAGITLGGLGTAYGALLGCVVVGLLVQLSTLVVSPDLKYVGSLLVLIVILVIRPQGILGSRQRIG